jgi:N-formylmaleamate deformylase
VRLGRTIVPGAGDVLASDSMTTSPAAVADALAEPAPGVRLTAEGAGVPFSALTWGAAGERPLLLIHGVTASAEIWWRVGPALAASGRRVVAVDLPGHGHTGHWTGRSRFAETAADLAEAIRGAGLATPDLQVVAHSWGSMVSTCLPSVGIRPETLVLLDPPTITREEIVREIAEAQGVATAGFDPLAAMRALHPDWTEGDITAAANAFEEVDLQAAADLLLGNGDWDSGLAELAGPAAAGIDVRVVRGEPAFGGRTPDAAAAEYARRYGADHVITIRGAPHSPQPTHPAETVAAFLRCLDD